MDRLKAMFGKALGESGLLESLAGLSKMIDEKLEMEEEEKVAGKMSPALIQSFEQIDLDLEDDKRVLERESEDWHRAFERKQDELSKKYTQRNKENWNALYAEMGIEKTEDDERHFRVNLTTGTVSLVTKKEKPKKEEENPIDFRKKP